MGSCLPSCRNDLFSSWSTMLYGEAHSVASSACVGIEKQKVVIFKQKWDPSFLPVPATNIFFSWSTMLYGEAHSAASLPESGLTERARLYMSGTVLLYDSFFFGAHSCFIICERRVVVCSSACAHCATGVSLVCMVVVTIGLGGGAINLVEVCLVRTRERGEREREAYDTATKVVLLVDPLVVLWLIVLRLLSLLSVI